jgi:Xaa-Pro aminopeptidase
MRKVPRSELQERARRLNELLKEKVSVAILTANSDLFYFTGTVQTGVLGFVEGTPIFMVRKSYERAKELSPLNLVTQIQSFKDIPKHLGEPSVIGIPFETTTLALFNRLKRVYPETEWVDISREVRMVKSVKSPWELEQLMESAKLMARVFDEVPKVISSSSTDTEALTRLLSKFLECGHIPLTNMRNPFQELGYGVLLAGKNACIPSFLDSVAGGKGRFSRYPYGVADHAFSAGEPIMVDLIANANGYLVDQTRTYLYKEHNIKVENAYRFTKRLLKALEEFIRPGITASEVYNFAVKEAEKSDFGKYFMGYGEGKVGFIGHGIGTEIDEYPIFAAKMDIVLEENMVFALEPKVVLPKIGAIGIENTYVLTSKGAEPITKYPEDLLVLQP